MKNGQSSKIHTSLETYIEHEKACQKKKKQAKKKVTLQKCPHPLRATKPLEGQTNASEPPPSAVRPGASTAVPLRRRAQAAGKPQSRWWELRVKAVVLSGVVLEDQPEIFEQFRKTQVV